MAAFHTWARANTDGVIPRLLPARLFDRSFPGVNRGLQGHRRVDGCEHQVVEPFQPRDHIRPRFGMAGAIRMGRTVMVCGVRVDGLRR
jgi:hypothetical protein